MTDTAALVVVDDLKKHFHPLRGFRDLLRGTPARTLEVVRGVSFRVAPGEFYGLLGVNGAGKTTLMKMLSTLLIPDSGSAQVGGHDVVREATAVRDLVSISLATERGLFWRLSARENLRLFGTLNRLAESELHGKIATVLEVVGLADAADRMVGEYSSGMIQRLFVARALLAQPRVLLLDEPTRSLDPISARAFRTFLREELAKKRQSAVVLATHDADEAFDLCDRVAILHHGVLVAEGPARELAARYVEPRVTVRTREPAHPAFASLTHSPFVRRVSPADPAGDGWGDVHVFLDGGETSGAQVLQKLVSAGVEVSEFTAERASLADLLERVTQVRA